MAKVFITAGPYLYPKIQETRESTCADAAATEEFLHQIRQIGYVEREAESMLHEMVVFERLSVANRKPNRLRSFTVGSLKVGQDTYKVFVEADFADPKNGFIDLHIQTQRICPTGGLEIETGIHVIAKNVTSPNWAMN